MKDNNQYELVLVIRSGDLDEMAGILYAARKHVKKVIRADRIEEVGGEESGAESFCSGWYDFSIRNREMSADPPTPTQFPIRVNVDTLGHGVKWEAVTLYREVIAALGEKENQHD